MNFAESSKEAGEVSFFGFSISATDTSSVTTLPLVSTFLVFSTVPSGYLTFTNPVIVLLGDGISSLILLPFFGSKSSFTVISASSYASVFDFSSNVSLSSGFPYGFSFSQKSAGMSDISFWKSSSVIPFSS